MQLISNQPLPGRMEVDSRFIHYKESAWITNECFGSQQRLLDARTGKAQ